MTSTHNFTLALRIADPDDQRTLRRLASLDDSRPLEGDALIALIDGEAVAAISLDDGRTVANPFVPTSDAVALLELRASQLSHLRERPRVARIPRRGLGRVPRLRVA